MPSYAACLSHLQVTPRHASEHSNRKIAQVQYQCISQYPDLQHGKHGSVLKSIPKLYIVLALAAAYYLFM